MAQQQQDQYRCLDITVLKKPRCEEAKQLLEKVAKQVQPIMRKRCWRVGKLSEFVPRNPGLLGLNINKGQEVKIRLRPARDPDSFYDWHHILGTMLHELCHNEISAHNAAFYKLLDELWGEAEELMDKGITGSGAGFDAPSAGRLGSHAFIPIHNPPEHRMAEAVRKAAEARAKQQSVMPSGPRKLGSAGTGGINFKQLTPAQAAAQAAERRARDNVWCGAEHSADEVEREVGQQVDSVDSTGLRPGGGGGGGGGGGSAAVGQIGSAQAPAAAAATTRSSLHPTGAAQQQAVDAGRFQQQQQGTTTTTTAAAVNPQQPPVTTQQQQALQQQWQQHLQQRQTQRQEREHRPRKRPAVDTVDLTITDSDEDDDDDDAGIIQVATVAAAASAAGGSTPRARVQIATTCPCCAAAVGLDAAVMQRLQNRSQQWCEAHKQQLQQPGCWACRVCTLVNPAGVLACQACLTLKNAI